MYKSQGHLRSCHRDIYALVTDMENYGPPNALVDQKHRVLVFLWRCKDPSSTTSSGSLFFPHPPTLQFFPPLCKRGVLRTSHLLFVGFGDKPIIDMGSLTELDQFQGAQIKLPIVNACQCVVLPRSCQFPWESNFIKSTLSDPPTNVSPSLRSSWEGSVGFHYHPIWVTILLHKAAWDFILHWVYISEQG